MKRTVLLFLLLCLLITTGCKEKNEPIEPPVASGTTGELRWVLSSDGTLTISGNGEMPDYSHSRPQWFDYLSSTITAIVINNGITSIGIGAFSGCIRLTSVIIPNSVTYISGSAFSQCSSLTSVTIPNSVTFIERTAFYDCNNLIFINVDNGNAAYSSEDGVLFNKTKNTLILYPSGKIGAYIIPNSVTFIEFSAFSRCINLTSVTIPNSVTSIEEHAFVGCSSLTEIINESIIPQDILELLGVDRSACILRVPAASLEAYRTAEVWKNFANIVAIGETNKTAMSFLQLNNLLNIQEYEKI